MNAKLSNLSELANMLSVKSEIRANIGHGALCFVGLAKMGNTKYKALCGTLGDLQVRIFLIRYGHNQRWNVLLTSDVSMSFVKAFETYLIRWNIEVLNKEVKQYLGLGSYQGRDFDGQIADCTICFITYIVMALEKLYVSVKDRIKPRHLRK